MSDNLLMDFSVPLKEEAENLDIEFKRSLPLGEKAGKSKLAKEICALANHGGGWIVLGREDDGSYPNSLPDDLAEVDQDIINQIASAYLQPAPHCSVRWVKPSDVDFEVLVIWVSPLGVSPVSGAKNGPNGDTGGTIGVTKGTHYIRKAGPVSAPIETPDEWQTVIRRCVLSDKISLLAALTTMLERPNPNSADEEKTILDAEFKHLIEVWKEAASQNPYEVDLSKNFICYSFHFVEAEGVTIGQIAECLRSSVDHNRGEHVFFDITHNSPNKPKVLEIAKTDGLEVYANSIDFDLRSAWRVSESLSGTELISYWEDTAWIKSAVEHNSSRTWERGRAIWIDQQISYCNGFLRTVKYIADYFNYNGSIRVRVLFSGLKGRSLGSPRSFSSYSSNYEFHQDTKLIDLTINVNALEPEARSSTIAALVQPMNKLAQGPEITAARVVSGLRSDR